MHAFGACLILILCVFPGLSLQSNRALNRNKKHSDSERKVSRILDSSSCIRNYTIQSGDTCFSVQNYVFQDLTLISQCKSFFQCSATSPLQVGQTVCLCSSQYIQTGIPTIPSLGIPPSPPLPCERYYTIQQGDTCIQILLSVTKAYPQCLLTLSCGSSLFKVGDTVCVCLGLPFPPSSNLNPPSNQSPPNSPKLPPPVAPPQGNSPPIKPPPPPPQEFDSRVLFLNAPVPQVNKNAYFRYASFKFTGKMGKPNWDLAASVNLTDYFGPVEDQGGCNACWAMTSGAAFEGLYTIATDTSLSVSKQQLLDCSVVPNNGSCGGGWPTDGFEYMVTKGVGSTRDYPYVGNQQTCFGQQDPNLHRFKISMYEEIDFYGSFGLVLAVQNQPVVVNIQGSSSVFQQFKGGQVFDSPNCFTSGVDHTVLVVGYNLFQARKPFWILRNSWGTSWGENGYMRIAYTGGDGVCGMHTTPAYYPVLPSSVGFQSPCGPPNPCGGGVCSANPLTGKNRCICPATFVAVKNKDGSQTCATFYPCKTKSYNPCGYGACVDDLRGSYTCICPPGFVQDTFSDTDQFTCKPATSSNKNLVYVVQLQNTCDLIWKTFRLEKTQFLAQNPKLNCNNPLKVGTVVNVTQSVNWKNCRVSYSWNLGDSCNGIQSLFKISKNDLLGMNPGLDCNNVLPGTQVCVQLGTPIDYVPPCGQFYTLQNGDTCPSIIANQNLDPFTFFIFNRGINCQYLIPQSSQNIFLDQVCISSQYLGTPRCNGKSMSVVRFDTCASIVFKRFQRSYSKFRKCNKQLPCRGLVVGMPYCICK